jgi:CRP/FNR family transcriptional regulator
MTNIDSFPESADNSNYSQMNQNSEPIENARSSSKSVDIVRFLSSLKEFKQIPSSDLESLAYSSKFSSIDAGEYISIEGDQEGLYGFIIVTGCIAMVKNSVSGKELIVELLQAYDVFGLLLTLAAEKFPYQLSARCLQRTTVLWVPIQLLNNLLKLHPILFKEFTAHLLICLQSSYRISRGLAHDLVEVRIAAVLGALVSKFNVPSIAKKFPTIRFTRKQIADLTGTTPETAIRVTRAMQRDGLIDIKRPGIIGILNLAGLLSLAES